MLITYDWLTFLCLKDFQLISQYNFQLLILSLTFLAPLPTSVTTFQSQNHISTYVLSKVIHSYFFFPNSCHYSMQTLKLFLNQAVYQDKLPTKSLLSQVKIWYILHLL